MQPNPYEPPPSSARDVGRDKPLVGRRQLRLILMPTLVGGLAGAILLAPFTSGPGDPRGHLVGGAMGTVLGLVAGLLIRSVKDDDASGPSS